MCEEQFDSCWMECVFSCVLKMGFVLVRSDVRAKASRPKLFHVVCVCFMMAEVEFQFFGVCRSLRNLIQNSQTKFNQCVFVEKEKN